MKKLASLLFPATADRHFPGSPLALWIFALLAAVSTIRSLIHFLAPDGGAGTIAGLDLSLGAENIIFSFGLWGLAQLLYACIQLLVVLKYRSLVPLFYLILILELLGRMALGVMKPPVLLQGTPPGGIANYVLLSLCLVMFVLSLYPLKKSAGK